ncbi:hypothetical protein D623_10016356 [Myotis brandtii]|uniref:Uncharacterized protein n=1 Tax=Myotis brandtii TaxID=109478 RepID=S7MGU7_MYOBR|nr:hypothetical protein D623_10016356 [Myotis brandtii]
MACFQGTVAGWLFASALEGGVSLGGSTWARNCPWGESVRHQGPCPAAQSAGRGALHQTDELPGGPGRSWASGRDIKAGKAAPSAQPSGFTSPGAGGHNRVTSFLAWESPLGGWGRVRGLAPSWGGGGGAGGRTAAWPGQERWPLETLNH